MDFYFGEKQQGIRFIDFLSSHVPTKAKYSRKLISADHKSNVGKFKHNHIVEIVPLCKVIPFNCVRAGLTTLLCFVGCVCVV